MGNITRKHFHEFDAPSLEQPPSELAMKRQRGHRQEAPDEGDEYEVQCSSGKIPLQIEAPVDRNTQGTYDHLDYIIRQNEYIIQTNRAKTDFYNAYLTSQNTYEREQVTELNAALAQWTLDLNAHNHFSEPLEWTSFQPPPPPPPY